MCIVASIIQRKQGLPSCHTELQHQARTQGHAATEGGLRGHSVGDTWPYRVVGVGSGWEVHRNGSPQRIRCDDCGEAHEWARVLKAQAVANAEAVAKRQAAKALAYPIVYGTRQKLTATLAGESNE